MVQRLGRSDEMNSHRVDSLKKADPQQLARALGFDPTAELSDPQLLLAAKELGLKAKTADKSDQAREVGKALATAAKAVGIDTVVFDRGGYLYHGRVKALAEGAREGGLSF